MGPRIRLRAEWGVYLGFSVSLLCPVPPMCAPSKIKKKFFLKRERIHRARRARVLLRKVCEGTGRKGIPGRTRGDTGRVAADWTERHPLRRGGPPER